jgi:hypothetical protein
MTTALKLAEEMYAEDFAPAGTLAHKLIAIVDQRFAELREKERGDHAGERTDLSADEWEPTHEMAIQAIHDLFPASYPHMAKEETAMHARTWTTGAIAGHRIAKGECKCSKELSPVSSPLHFGITSATAVATKPEPSTLPASTTTSSTAPDLSKADDSNKTPPAASLDERAEALFAKRPEWRPKDANGFPLEYTIGGNWPAITGWIYRMSPRAYYSESNANPHLTAALLPRAIDKWEHKYYLVRDSRKSGVRIYNALERCPRDLESAIRALEGK